MLLGWCLKKMPNHNCPYLLRGGLGGWGTEVAGAVMVVLEQAHPSGR